MFSLFTIQRGPSNSPDSRCRKCLAPLAELAELTDGLDEPCGCVLWAGLKSRLKAAAAATKPACAG